MEKHVLTTYKSKGIKISTLTAQRMQKHVHVLASNITLIQSYIQAYIHTDPNK